MRLKEMSSKNDYDLFILPLDIPEKYAATDSIYLKNLSLFLQQSTTEQDIQW